MICRPSSKRSTLHRRFVVGNAGRLVVGAHPSGAEPGLEPAVAQQVERRELLGEDDRMPVVVVEDESADPQRRGGLGGGGDRDDRRPLVVEVIGDVQRRVAERLRPCGRGRATPTPDGAPFNCIGEPERLGHPSAAYALIAERGGDDIGRCLLRRHLHRAAGNPSVSEDDERASGLRPGRSRLVASAHDKAVDVPGDEEGDVIGPGGDDQQAGLGRSADECGERRRLSGRRTRNRSCGSCPIAWMPPGRPGHSRACGRRR